MSQKITLATESKGRRIVAGIPFFDGVAVVESLTATRRAFFDAIGATVGNTSKPAIESAEDLDGLTVAELRNVAGDHEVELPAKATRAKLIEELASVLFPTAQAEPIVQTIPTPGGEGMGAHDVAALDVAGGTVTSGVSTTDTPEASSGR